MSPNAEAYPTYYCTLCTYKWMRNKCEHKWRNKAQKLNDNSSNSDSHRNGKEWKKNLNVEKKNVNEFKWISFRVVSIYTRNGRPISVLFAWCMCTLEFVWSTYPTLTYRHHSFVIIILDGSKCSNFFFFYCFIYVLHEHVYPIRIRMAHLICGCVARTQILSDYDTLLYCACCLLLLLLLLLVFVFFSLVFGMSACNSIFGWEYNATGN